jgi:hypothetical protein
MRKGHLFSTGAVAFEINTTTGGGGGGGEQYRLFQPPHWRIHRGRSLYYCHDGVIAQVLILHDFEVVLLDLLHYSTVEKQISKSIVY